MAAGSTGHRFVVNGTKGTLVVQAVGSPHTGPVKLLGAQGNGELESITVTMPDGEDSYSGDYGGRYQRTWKNLKAIDKAIETIS